MKNKYLEKLEYNKILQILSSFCNTYIGREFCNNLKPLYIKKEVLSSLSETSEALSLLYRIGPLPICSIFDISNSIHILEKEGTLSLKALLEITLLLKLARQLKEYLSLDSTINIEQYTILSELFSKLYSNKGIENTIYSKILDENTLDDKSSKKLYDIRRNTRSLEKEIKEKLNSFLHSSKNNKYIQDPIITIKNDRFVIPIKEEFRGQVKGLIHDISSSGSTLFIEPLSVFELNNQVNNLKIEETIEIEHILQELSFLFLPIIKEIRNNVFLIGKLDFIFAKAMYSKQIDGIAPNINEEKFIDLKQARHPLIEKDKVVPIDVHIGSNFSCLVITGPNTGGKTVTLKTIGLLQTMALSGLHIPAKENSSIYIFDQIFADIGDDQSIVESLSTFSSHMLNIIDILEVSTSNSLVLLDELGSGTDPIEGSSLAISILEELYKKGCLIVATTHYQELKHYALVEKGFENASSEFDVENLKPTYKLLLGIPGKSNAFSISRRLGMKETILKKANELLTTDTIHIEELLKSIHDSKLDIEQKQKEVNQKLREVDLLKQTLENDTSDIEQKIQEDLSKAKIEARNILIEAKEEANEIIKEVNNIYHNIDQNSVKDLNNIRNKLNKSIQSYSKIEKKEKETPSNTKINLSSLKVGMKVFISSFGQEAIILSLPNKSNEVQIQMGIIKTTTSVNNISKILTENNLNSKTNQSNSVKIQNLSNLKSKTITTEINVIGFNVEESLFLIDKFLDDAAISRLESIRIVHGKGTGKLREGIHNFLKKHPHVQSYRIGTYGEGEMGVTIVEIK